MINVLIVEDSKITRNTIERQLSSQGEYSIKASIENAANAEIACLSGNIDLVLMDVCTADGESGLLAAKSIKLNYPKIKIIIMTSMPEHSFIKKAKDYGCDSFWYKEYGNTDLLDICSRTMNGESVWPTELPVIPVGCTDSTELTEKEYEIIKNLSLGLKYEEIADEMGITVNTVKYHIKNLLQKTGYRNTVQLAVNVIDKRLILPKY